MLSLFICCYLALMVLLYVVMIHMLLFDKDGVRFCLHIKLLNYLGAGECEILP